MKNILPFSGSNRSHQLIRLIIITLAISVLTVALPAVKNYGWQIFQYLIPWSIYLIAWILFIIIGSGKNQKLNENH